MTSLAAPGRRLWAPVRPKPAMVGPAIRRELERAGVPLATPYSGPVVLRLRFIFARPASERAPTPIAEPASSIAGLVTNVLRELVGTLYSDERQVVALHVGKEYGNENGIEVRW